MYNVVYNMDNTQITYSGNAMRFEAMSDDNDNTPNYPKRQLREFLCKSPYMAYQKIKMLALYIATIPRRYSRLNYA